MAAAENFDVASHVAPHIDKETWLSLRLVSRAWDEFFHAFCREPDYIMALGRMLGGSAEFLDITKYKRTERNRELYNLVLRSKFEFLDIESMSYVVGAAARLTVFEPAEIADLFGGCYDEIVLNRFQLHGDTSWQELALLSDHALTRLALQTEHKTRVLKAAYARGFEFWWLYEGSRLYVRCPRHLPQWAHVEFMYRVTKNVSSMRKFNWRRICPRCIPLVFTEMRGAIPDPVESLAALERVAQMDLGAAQADVAALLPPIPLWISLLDEQPLEREYLGAIHGWDRPAA